MYVDMELSKPFTPSPASLFKAQEREPEGEAVVSFVEKTVHSGVAVNRNSTFFSVSSPLVSILSSVGKGSREVSSCMMS